MPIFLHLYIFGKKYFGIIVSIRVTFHISNRGFSPEDFSQNPDNYCLLCFFYFFYTWLPLQGYISIVLTRGQKLLKLYSNTNRLAIESIIILMKSINIIVFGHDAICIVLMTSGVLVIKFELTFKICCIEVTCMLRILFSSMAASLTLFKSS